MFKQILVAIDMSPASIRGLKTAVELAKDQQAELHVVHVFGEHEIPPYGTARVYLPASFKQMNKHSAREVARRFVENATATAVADGVAVQPILVDMAGGDIAHLILAQAKKVKADVIVLGTHGRRGLERIVMGSDAESVVRQSTVPVLMVRAQEPAKARKSSSKAAMLSVAGAVASASREPSDPQPRA